MTTIDTKRKKQNIISICVIVCSILFGLAHMLTGALGRNGDIDYFRFPVGVALFLFAFVTLLYAVRWYRENTPASIIRISDSALFAYSFFIVMIASCFWLLIYYPGVGMYDSIAIVKDENYAIAKQHPWFYVFLIKCLKQVAFFFGGDFETVLVAESLSQIMISSLLCAYCALWLKRRKISPLLIFCCICYYAFDPMLNMYRISLFKDIPFSILLVIWVTILYDIWRTCGYVLALKKARGLLIICLFLSLLRNNGVYVSFFILLCLLVTYRKQYKRVIALFVVLALVIVCSSVFERKHKITHLFKETVGIPLQQIGATIAYDGVVTEDQAEFISQVIPLEFIKENYNPYTADTLKWGGAPIDDAFLNTHKTEFIRVWAQMLSRNFGIYVKAYLQNTYGFWATNASRIEKHDTIYVPALDDWFNVNDIDIQNIFPESIQSDLVTITYNDSNALGEGQLFWLFILLMLVLLKIKGWKAVIPGVPIIGAWLTLMISTPVAHQWRYILYIPLSIPFFIGMILSGESSSSVCEEGQDLSW